MSEAPANWTPPPEAPKAQLKTAWKPLLITLVASALLGLVTCAGGLSLVGKHSDSGVFLIGAALLLAFVFLTTMAATVVYFFIWLIEVARSK
jgi:hypothetical protein